MASVVRVASMAVSIRIVPIKKGGVGPVTLSYAWAKGGLCSATWEGAASSNAETDPTRSEAFLHLEPPHAVNGSTAQEPEFPPKPSGPPRKAVRPGPERGPHF